MAGLEPRVAGSRLPAWHWVGSLASAMGILWGRDFPVIKILWTSTYVLMAGGWSLLLLALVLHDHRRDRFALLGVFLRRDRRKRDHDLRRISGSFLFREISRFLLGGAARLSGSFGPVLLAIGTLVIEWLLLLHLYRNRIFLRV